MVERRTNLHFPPPPMSARSKRTGSSARPGQIIVDSKQKRRTADEKAAEDLLKEQAKAAKEKAAADQHQAGVQRIADKEDALRLEDEASRIHSARPDIVTAELKRNIAKRHQRAEASLFFSRVFLLI